MTASCGFVKEKQNGSPCVKQFLTRIKFFLGLGYIMISLRSKEFVRLSKYLRTSKE